MKQQRLEKPTTMKVQIDELWNQCFNHLPSMIRLVNLKVTFTLVFLGLILGLLGILIARIP